MKSALTGIFLFISLMAFCQRDTVFIRQTGITGNNHSKLNYKTDTILFESDAYRAFLFGTTIIPLSENSTHAFKYGISLYHIEKSDCKGVEKNSPFRDKIVLITKTDSSLNIEAEVIANCCYSFLCDVKVENDSVLNLISMGYNNSTECMCLCCFGLTYQMRLERSLSEKTEFKKIRYIMINDDKATIKPINN